jgi:hypothetical protein
VPCTVVLGSDPTALLTPHDPAVLVQLKQLAIERDTTQQKLLAEALNLLFAKYGSQSTQAADRLRGNNAPRGGTMELDHEARHSLLSRLMPLSAKLCEAITTGEAALELLNVVPEVRGLLRREETLGPWEQHDLNRAEALLRANLMPLLAIHLVFRTLDVSRQRATGVMPTEHYRAQVDRL